MTVSYERAKLLIEVVKGAADLGPNEANNIMAMAVAELRAMDSEAKEELAKRAEKARKDAEAKRKEEAKVEPEPEVKESEDDSSKLSNRRL